MPADKIFFQPEGDHFLVDGGLNASRVGQDAAAVDQIFKLGKVSGIVCYRRAEKNISAAPEIFIYRRTGGMDCALLDRQRQCLAVFVKGEDLVIRIILPYRFCDGASDQSESDKADFY